MQIFKNKIVALTLLIIGLFYILFALQDFFSKSNQVFRECKSSSQNVIPFDFEYGMSREYIARLVKQNFENVEIKPMAEFIDMVHLSNSHSTIYSQIYFAYKQNRLSAIWFKRKYPETNEYKVFEKQMNAWMDDFENRMGRKGINDISEKNKIAKIWYFSTGEVRRLVIDDLAFREEFTCKAAQQLDNYL